MSLSELHGGDVTGNVLGGGPSLLPPRVTGRLAEIRAHLEVTSDSPGSDLELRAARKRIQVTKGSDTMKLSVYRAPHEALLHTHSFHLIHTFHLMLLQGLSPGRDCLRLADENWQNQNYTTTKTPHATLPQERPCSEDPLERMEMGVARRR